MTKPKLTTLIVFCCFLFTNILVAFGSQPYKRDLYRHWIDIDGDCQNERDELLIEQSKIKPTLSSDSCKVLSGEWIDFYTGMILKNTKDIDIDHVVPLAEAHKSGAGLWDSSKREAFANDHENLVITIKKVNRSKGSKNITEWPNNNKYPSYFVSDNVVCEYAKKWQYIKIKYGLDSENNETTFLTAVINKC